MTNRANNAFNIPAPVNAGTIGTKIPAIVSKTFDTIPLLFASELLSLEAEKSPSLSISANTNFTSPPIMT
ncbi:hypothetical protein LOS25_14880 [Enterococcus faecium]|nr:hypothetical protein [Enterococcus faecium]